MRALGQNVIAYEINVGCIIQSFRPEDFIYTTIFI